MRKLASIQTISAIEPIPKADAIERLRVLGWWVVSKRGEYTVGDRVVYCEIDSLLPVREDFEFLRKGCFLSEVIEGGQVVRPAGFRIRTVKLRGQVSQGICFPLSILPDDRTYEVGDDVTELLGIAKYETPVPMGMSGRVKGPFPGFLPKTDETRVQVLEEVLQSVTGTTFTITEKLDGTSFTAFLRGDEYGLCSRNQWLDETDTSNTLCRLAEELKLKEKLKTIADRFGIQPAIQGEVIGPGIQGNRYGLKTQELHIFNVLDIGEYALVDRSRQSEMLQHVGLTEVPNLGDIVLDHTIDELVDLSIGQSTLNPKGQREGIVFRPEREVDVAGLGRLSFKAINPKFLLKYGE